MTEELLSLTNVATHYVHQKQIYIIILLINADVIIPDVLLFRCRLTGLNNCLALGEVLCLTKQKCNMDLNVVRAPYMYLLIITVYLIKLLLHGDTTKYFICLVGLGEKVCSVH